MKIAILAWNLNINGGTQRQALELALNMQKLGHLVDVYCYIYEKDKCYTDICKELKIFFVTANSQSQENKKTLKSNKIFSVFRKHANTIIEIFKTDSSIKELKKLIIKNRPTDYYDVINVHDYQVYKISRIIHHRNMVWMMNDIQRYSPSKNYYIFQKIYKKIQSVLINKETKNISKITVLDKRNLQLCKEIYKRDAIVVRSGVDLNMFSNIDYKNDTNHQTWKIFASSIFFPYRRFEDLVDAIEILIKDNITNLSVTINGFPNLSYEYYTKIKKRIEEKNLERYITIIPGMSEDVLKKQYMESDIFVFPNNNQTWGLAVFEAMLAGCCCIVSRGSGAHEVLTDKENAILVNPLSPDEIATAMKTLMKSPDEIKRIAINGSQFVKENLSWKKYAEQMLSVFDNKFHSK
jgi:glycosyltransferase involved in cell wall biosynthesis